MKSMLNFEAVYAALRQKTAPGILQERAEREPEKAAYFAKQLGVYRRRSWRVYRDAAAQLAEGLAALGIGAGDRLAIMGDACEEWSIADLAAQALGAVTYGIYPTASVSEVEYQMRQGGARIFVAEDQQYVDRILAVAANLPELRWIVVIDTTALFAYRDERLKSFADVIESGRKAGASSATFAARVARLEPAAPAFIVFTSGTTGHPKGAVITHGTHLAGAYNMAAHYSELRAQPQRTVVYLPLCHVFGRDLAITLPLLTDMVPFYGASVEDLHATLFEVAPTILFTVPRYLQKFAAQILVGIENTSAVKRAAYRLGLAAGRRGAQRRWAKKPPGLAARLAQALVFAPILNQYGLGRLELVLCGGAPMPPATAAFWHICGVNVAEIYGQTETAGAIISGQPSPFPRPGDVGVPPPGWQTELAANGEILVRGRDLFSGYWQQRADDSFTADGRLKTGDVGEITEGRLRIVDRARDFMVTTGGKTLSPTTIENALRTSAYVSEAIVFGHNRKYVTALLEIDFDTVADWARTNDVSHAGFTSLVQQPAVLNLLEREVRKANEALARVEQVKQFRILPKQLDPEEEGEPVTPTRKVKRELMYQRFKALVDSMYETSEEERIARDVGDTLVSPVSHRPA